MTSFQGLLGRGLRLAEKADPEKVSVQGYPKPLDANVGEIRRQRVQIETAWRWLIVGKAVIRREVLRPFNLPDPDSGQEITVRGKVYRIEFSSGDSTTVTLDFCNIE